MGWASGVSVLDDVWAIVEEVIPEERRFEFASKLVQVFEEHDADTVDESAHPILRHASDQMRLEDAIAEDWGDDDDDYEYGGEG